MSSRGGRSGRAPRMKTHLMRCAALALASLSLTPAAHAADSSMLGRWQIVEAQPAPWSTPEQQASLTAAGKRMVGTEVTFAASSVKSKFKPWDCKSKVIYTANSIEVDALFQGNLPEPNPTAAAARLGFPKGKDVPGVDVRCLKALYTFHFRDPNTALINLDRVIYTLQRQ
jgi:hypothetical protein